MKSSVALALLVGIAAAAILCAWGLLSYEPSSRDHATTLGAPMQPAMEARSKAIPLAAGIAQDGSQVAPSGNYSQAFASPLQVQGGAAQASPQGESPAAEEGQQDGAHIDSVGNRSDLAWGQGRIYVKADVPGVHYNLNQPAKAVDANATEWSLVFSVEAPFRAEDQLWFCGPMDTINVQVYDAESDLILYDDALGGVLPC